MRKLQLKNCWKLSSLATWEEQKSKSKEILGKDSDKSFHTMIPTYKKHKSRTLKDYAKGKTEWKWS